MSSNTEVLEAYVKRCQELERAIKWFKLWYLADLTIGTTEKEAILIKKKKLLAVERVISLV